MKRTLFILLLILSFSAVNVNASRFRFILNPLTQKASSDNVDTNIYCDIKNHWCAYGAMRLYKEGIYTGIKIGKNYYYQPETPITRGDFLLYVNSIINMPEDSSFALPFGDSSSVSYWQKPVISAMYRAGIIKGNLERDKLYINSDQHITRLECAIILNNILKGNKDYAPNDYSDSYLIPKYASSSVKNVTDYHIMRGYEDKSFRPYIKVTRAMLADILCNLKDYCEKDPQTILKLKNLK